MMTEVLMELMLLLMMMMLLEMIHVLLTHIHFVFIYIKTKEKSGRSSAQSWPQKEGHSLYLAGLAWPGLINDEGQKFLPSF
jgi:maltodextrin utilization protein YvdJ